MLVLQQPALKTGVLPRAIASSCWPGPKDPPPPRRHQATASPLRCQDHDAGAMVVTSARTPPAAGSRKSGTGPDTGAPHEPGDHHSAAWPAGQRVPEHDRRVHLVARHGQGTRQRGRLLDRVEHLADHRVRRELCGRGSPASRAGRGTLVRPEGSSGTGRPCGLCDPARCGPLRPFLAFAHADGLAAAGLASAVPATASWKLAGLPRALAGEQVAALLGSCDGASVVGRRDSAVLAVLSRLGLRAGEVARLRLDDIDWRRGEMTVRGKGGRSDRLPLPATSGRRSCPTWLAAVPAPAAARYSSARGRRTGR
jgi:hypothetical protein